MSLCQRNLTKRGVVVPFVRDVSSSFDPALGIDTTTPLNFNGLGRAYDYKKSEIDGTVICDGDLKLMVHVDGNTPEVGDSVTVDSIEYRVMTVGRKTLCGTYIVHWLQLR